MPLVRRADNDKPNLPIGSLNPSKALNVDKILLSTYKDAISPARFKKNLANPAAWLQGVVFSLNCVGATSSKG
jgi:hypothetical protein